MENRDVPIDPHISVKTSQLSGRNVAEGLRMNAWLDCKTFKVSSVFRVSESMMLVFSKC